MQKALPLHPAKALRVELRLTSSRSAQSRTTTTSRSSVRSRWAIARELTIVERWICQNCSGSSSASRSLSARRISDSPRAVTTRVYFRSDWKKSTSSTGISRT
jgi:hypothetical protein